MDKSVEQLVAPIPAAAMSRLWRISSLAKGLAMSLDGMVDDLCKDSRYYILRLCIDEILEKSESAAEALDVCWLSNLREDGA